MDLSSIALAKADAIRDDLPRDVLSYAEGLRREMYLISRKYGVEKPADIGPKIASGEVSLADMDRMVELKKALEKAVAEKRIPFRMEAYRDALREFAELFALEDPSHWQAAVEKLPMVPQDQLLSRDTFLQDVVDALGSNLPKDKREVVWPAVARIVARVVETMLPEVRERVTQYIRADGMKGIGYRWSCGTLVVLGMDGGYLGHEMSGGTIRAGAASGNAGLSMKGGILEITGGPAIDYLGFRMEGGEIRAKNGGDSVGRYMTDGVIRVLTAVANAGMRMSGGELHIAESAGERLGAGMTGGLIEAYSCDGHMGENMEGGVIRAAAGISVGYNMKGGTIEIDSASDVGSIMRGGRIEVGDASRVGQEMRDGTIVVRRSADVAGLGMSGGTILLRGTAAQIVRIGEEAHPVMRRSGGTIRYDGPWAWWKNLFVK